MPAIFFDTNTALGNAASFIGGTAGNGGVAGIGGAAGQARDVGQSNGGLGTDINRFGAVVNTDQAGNLFIDGSFDGVTWRQQGTIAAVVGGSADLSVPIRFRYYRTRYVNGATPTGGGNFSIHSSFLSE